MSYGLFITRHCKLKPAEENVRHYQSLGHLLHTLSVIVTLVYSVPFIILLSMAALSHSLPLPDHPVKATVLRDILYKYNIAYLITCTICQLSDPLKPEISLKGKGKGHPRTCHKGPEGEQRYSSTLSLTSVLDGGGWSTPRPGRFTPGNDSVLIVQEAGWTPGPVWTGAESLAPTGI
jgi:hypothetical protein